MSRWDQLLDSGLAKEAIVHRLKEIEFPTYSRDEFSENVWSPAKHFVDPRTNEKKEIERGNSKDEYVEPELIPWSAFSN